MTTLRIKYRKLGELKPYENNARTHDSGQVDQICASIDEFGFTNPILVDEDNGIIAGHGRLMAAERLKLEKVPTITLVGLTDAQRRAYVIADNKLALNAGWNPDVLAAEMGDLLNMDYDVGLTGFSQDEVHRLLKMQDDNEDETPPLPEKAKTKLGDIYEMGGHRLICGDATNTFHVEQLLDGVKPHLMVTDPPYGVNYDPAWRNEVQPSPDRALGAVSNDDNADWREAWANFPGDVAYVWHAGLYAGIVGDSLIATGFTIRSQIIWAKNQITFGRSQYHWQHEPCWYAVKGKGHWSGDRKQSTIWDIDKPMKSETGHSTQKPVECMRRPIMNNSSVGQVVYDPFLGSGTTLIAAETEGRYCYGLELDPLYCDVIVKRWEDFTGEKAKLIRPKKAA